MRLLTTTALCILWTLQLFGQTAGFNYVPLEFENLEPVWLHDIYDSTIIGHQVEENPAIRFDGFSHVSISQPTNPGLLVTTDAVYLASKIQYDNDIGGAIIERLDLETGQLEWKVLFDLRTQDRREYVMNMRIENDRLILYCVYLNEDNPYLASMFGNASGFLSIKEFDIESGDLLVQTIPDTTANLALLRTPRKDSELHFLRDDRIQAIRHGSDDLGSFFVIDTINREGIKLSPSDTLSHGLNLDWADTYVLRSYEFRKDHFTDDLYSIEYFNPNSQGPEARTSQLIRYGTRNGREVIPFEYDNYETLTSLEIREISYTHLIVVAQQEGNTSDILFVDKMTGVIDKVIYRNQGQQIGNSIIVEDDEVMAMNISREGSYYSLDIYRSEGSEMPLLKSFKLDFPDYLISGRGLHRLEDGDYLLEFQYRGFSPNGATPLGFFSGVMRITSDQLGLTTSSAEILNKVDAPVIIYPNPAVDNITVRSNEIKDYEVIIYDVMGKLIMSVTVEDYSREVDISELPTGHYYVQILTNDDSYASKLVVR